MSSLNLSPNPGFIVAQACVFLANVYAVNRLIVVPYLRLKDRRLAATSGGHADAAKTLMECDKISEKISQRLESAQAEIHAISDDIARQASISSESIIVKAKSEVSEYLEGLRSQLAVEIEQERLKIPGVVDQMSQQTFQAMAN